MDDNIGGRIIIILNESGLTQTAFCKKINISKQALLNYINNFSKPGYEIIYSILKEFPQYDANWLIKGQGKEHKEIADKLFKLKSDLENITLNILRNKY